MISPAICKKKNGLADLKCRWIDKRKAKDFQKYKSAKFVKVPTFLEQMKNKCKHLLTIL